MQGVEGQWNASVVVNGKEIPLHPKSLQEFLIFNTIHQSLPSLRCTFKDDVAAFLSGLGLTDSMPIDVIIGDGGTGQVGALRFTMLGDAKITGSHSAEQVTFNAVLDKLPWMRQIVSGAVKGTSGDAIQRVASMAGLKTEIHSTNDAMTWLPNNKPLVAYARSVMERGWASAQSCMMMSVSDSGLLRYFDIDRVGQSSGGKVFGEGGHPVLSYEIDSKADLYNNTTGFGATSINLTPEGIFKELTKIDVRMLSSNLSAGARNIASIGAAGGRILNRALDVGNVHKMFNEALHQNQRQRSLYSYDVNILTDKLSGVELQDLVQLNLVMHGTGVPYVGQTGSYIVTAYTRLLAGNRYFEKLTLTSQGTN